MQVLLRYRKGIPKQEYCDVSSPSYETLPYRLSPRMTRPPRLNTFLELKMENQKLQHRLHELRARNAPFLQTSSTSGGPTASALPPAFGAIQSSTTSSRLPIDSPPSTVQDHPESTAKTSGPVTRNFGAAGLQEGDQGEPAKKKVSRVQCLDTAYIIT